jgi:soluble lytic murein transglycosylase
LLLASSGQAAASDAPLCDWFSGIGEAAQSLVEGRPGDSAQAARRALEARPVAAAGARASAALGLALLAGGEPGLAAKALELALSASSAPARAHLSYLRGAALTEAGSMPEAARSLREATRADGFAISRHAGFLEGRALLEAGMAAEAVPVLEEGLRRAPAHPDAPTARITLATARRALRDDAGALLLYRAVWLDAVLPQSELAGERLAAWRSAGGPVPAPSGDDHLIRAERFLADARPDDALRSLASAAEAAQPTERPGLAQALRAGALLALGRHADAERVAGPLAGAEEGDVRRAAELVLARTAARAGRLEEAIQRYQAVGASAAPIPGLPAWRQRDIGDEALYLAAWLPYDAGDWSRAVRALSAFARTHPQSRRVDEARWFAGWSLHRLGRNAAAARAFARLSAGPLGDAAAYWQARLARGPRQRSLYRRAVELGGDGWYALLARARLARLGEHPPRARAAAPRPLPDAPEPAAATALSVAVELLGLGLEETALDELRALVEPPRARTSAVLVAQLAAFAGDAELPFRMARDRLAETRRAIRWGHPEPHSDALEAGAEAAGVDPALVLAIMRRESSFRSGARSGAGAEGLLQLRPITAERVAALLGLPGGPVSLREPRVNVALGVHYLGLLFSRFGDPAVALAGYNAGPAPAAEWARARAGTPLDEWVECIPYRETRQYLKIVLADWDVYRELRGEGPAPVDPSRPVPRPAEGVAF